MLYNGFNRESLTTRKTLILGFCFPLLCHVAPTPSPLLYLLHHPTPVPLSIRAVLLRSMCVWPGISLAELLSGSGPAFGARAVTQCLVGCHSAPLALCCSQSFSQQRGQPLIPPSPNIWLSRAPDSSHRQPNLSPLECRFSDLRLQIVHLQQCQSRNTISFGNIFLPQLMPNVLWLSPVSPGISVFPSKWVRETEIRGVL